MGEKKLFGGKDSLFSDNERAQVKACVPTSSE